MIKYILLFSALFLFENIFAQNVGIGTISPTDKLHINAPAGIDPLRVQANGSTKLRVFDNGGTTIGGLTIPPVNGLLVQGSIQPQNGITAITKLIIECTSDSLIFEAGGSRIIIAANGNITIKSALGGKLIVDAGADLELKGQNIKMQALSNITINGTSIRFNGGTRPASGVGDIVSGPAGAGTIITGSSSVFIDN